MRFGGCECCREFVLAEDESGPTLGAAWPLGHLEIYPSRPDGSDLRPLTSNGAYNAEATLSPDGNTILFTSTMDGDIELYTMKVDGTDIRRLTHKLGYDGGAFFSHDGKMIVWRANYPANARDSADYLWLVQSPRLGSRSRWSRPRAYPARSSPLSGVGQDQT